MSDNLISGFEGLNPLPYVEHLWTISYEEQFYVFIPLIILIASRFSAKRKVVGLVLIIILFNIFRSLLIMYEIPYPGIWVLPITRFESIILGLVIGFGGFDFLLRKSNPLFLGVIGVMLSFLLPLFPQDSSSHWSSITFIIVGISTALIIFAVINSAMLKKLFSNSILVFLGKRSYGLYVFHLLGNTFSVLLIRELSYIPSSSLASFMYSLLITILLAIVSYRYVEKPFLVLKKRYEVIISRPA